MRLRNRLTYANTVATLALFLALGGSSYAAISITGKNVKNGSLTGKDIKGSSLGTKQVKNGSLLAGDFKSGQLHPVLQDPRDPRAPREPQVHRDRPEPLVLPARLAPTPTSGPPARATTASSRTSAVSPRPPGRASASTACERPASRATQVAAVATPELVGSVAPTGAVTVYVARDDGGSCTAGDFRVQTYEAGAVTNNVAFNIVIP